MQFFTLSAILFQNLVTLSVLAYIGGEIKYRCISRKYRWQVIASAGVNYCVFRKCSYMHLSTDEQAMKRLCLFNAVTFAWRACGWRAFHHSNTNRELSAVMEVWMTGSTSVFLSLSFVRALALSDLSTAQRRDWTAAI